VLKDAMLKEVFDQGKLKGKLGEKKLDPAGKVSAMRRRLANKPVVKGPAEQASPVAKAAVAENNKNVMPAETALDVKAVADSKGVDTDLVAKMKALKGK